MKVFANKESIIFFSKLTLKQVYGYFFLTQIYFYSTSIVEVEKMMLNGYINEPSTIDLETLGEEESHSIE